MNFNVPPQVRVYCEMSPSSACAAFAVAELKRLLTGMNVQVVEVPRKDYEFRISLGACRRLSTAGVRHDGYRLTAEGEFVSICAKSAKGLLNGVYALAEGFGAAFLEPGPDGEWLPETPHPLRRCDNVCNPRFPWRGTCFQCIPDIPVQTWMRFHAKLRFNCSFIADEKNFAPAQEIAEELGMRLELGQHGFRGLLPREQFEQHPERFRMYQPADFGGYRTKDFNCCVTNPETQRELAVNFPKLLKTYGNAYAVHCWPDDLPGSGWCMCPSCRAMTSADQAQKAMNILGESARAAGFETRVAMLAYHDTMFPGSMIKPSPTTFLLFAPRERCYAHSLDDKNCRRNRFYMEALREWEKHYAGISDTHTFEYYFDQILFRGMYFFLPAVILADMKVYQAHGIETHSALQVAGPVIAPEYNMLVFADAHWNEKLNARTALDRIAKAIDPVSPKPFRRYLAARAEAFQRAAEMCNHDLRIYLDYRWLPENSGRFGVRSARNFQFAAGTLNEAADALEKAVADRPERVRKLARREIARARFEAMEFSGMTHQQEGVNALARFHSSNHPELRRKAVACFREAVELFKHSRSLAEAAGMPANAWYFRNINAWQCRELEEKIAEFDLESKQSK